MTEYEIRAMLRAATRAGILAGWYVAGFGDRRRFILNPSGGPTRQLTEREAEQYSGMLSATGIEPLYRESEPQ